jgi:acylphosphatase
MEAMTETASVVRARVIVHGRVQGVFFRESTRVAAEGRDLAGFVRNRPDGTVEAVFQGAPADVEALVEHCRRGPPRAQVTRLDLAWEPPVRGEPPFRVLR